MTSEVDRIKLFCGQPTLSNFTTLSYYTRLLFKEASEFCMHNERGATEIARKVIWYEGMMKVTEEKRRGIRALILAIAHLKNISKGLQFKPVVTVLTENATYRRAALTISYESDFKDMYSVTENITEFEREFNFAADGIKDYAIDLITEHDVLITSILLEMKPYKFKIFYNNGIGVILNKTSCLNCMILYKQHGVDCDYSGCEESYKLHSYFHPRAVQMRGEKVTQETDDYFRKLEQCEKELVDLECLSDIRHRPEKMADDPELFAILREMESNGGYILN